MVYTDLHRWADAEKAFNEAIELCSQADDAVARLLIDVNVAELAIAKGDYERWRTRELDEVEASGQQEILNWMCLAGALDSLGLAPRYLQFHENWIFNSPKVFLAAGGSPS